jgi:hypothetical protein
MFPLELWLEVAPQLPLASRLRFRQFFYTPIPERAQLGELVTKRALLAAIAEDDVAGVQLFRGHTPDQEIFNAAFPRGSVSVLESLHLSAAKVQRYVRSFCRCEVLTPGSVESFRWAGTTALQLGQVVDLVLLYDPVEVLQELHKLLHFPATLVHRHLDHSHFEFRHTPLAKVKWLQETFHLFEDPPSRTQLTRRDDWEELAHWFAAQYSD